MRDPRESKAWVPSGAGYVDGVDDSDLLRKMAEATERVNLLRNEFKLLSLTLDGPEGQGEFERGYARSRLWDLYAEQGAGVCLVLNRAAAIDAIAQHLNAAGQTAHRKVRYENLPTATQMIFNFEEIFGDLERLAQRIATNHVEELFLTKNVEWESEREYRFVVRSGAPFEFVDVASCLVAVIRGPASPPDSEHALSNFAREHGLGLGYLLSDHNDPKIVGRALAGSRPD